MDKIKKFFEKKKADTKFKLAGNTILENLVLFKINTKFSPFFFYR